MRRSALLLTTVLALAPAALLTACGGDDEDPEAEARTAALAYGKAFAAKDYQGLCDDLLATVAVTKINDAGIPCEIAMKTALEDVRKPTLTVLSVKVDGDVATVRTRSTAENQEAATEDLRIVKEKGRGWRVTPASLVPREAEDPAPQD